MEQATNLRRVVLIITAVTVGALLIAGLIGLATGLYQQGRVGPGGVTVDQTRSLALDGVKAVTVDVVSEGVRVSEGTGNELALHLFGTAATGDPEGAPHLVVERQGDTVSVRVTQERTFAIGFWWHSLDLEVSVPAGYAQRLSVKTVSGGVKVADHAYAGLAVTTTSGGVELGSVKATDVSFHTTSGSLTAASVAASTVDLSSTSGGMRISALTGDTTLRTVSGDVALTYAAAPSRIEARSTSGGVALKLPVDAQFLLDAHSTSGGIRCGFPITIQQNEHGGGTRALTGAVGNGTGRVTVRTVSGDIRIED